MHSPSEKRETAPPSYASVTGDDTISSSISPGFDRFVRIVGNHETLHFHAPNGMGCCTVPDVVQIRDSSENPILCIMTGRMIVASGSNRVVSSREVTSPSGEALISIGSGATQTLSSGDQILGRLDDDKLVCSQTLQATNVMGDVIFEGAGDNNMGGSGCGCCVECGFGCCKPNAEEFIFSHRGVTLGRLARSGSNSSGNKLEIFNSTDMDPRTKAILIYAGYSAFLMFFVDTKCGRIGDRGIGRTICCFLLIGTVILLSLPLLILL
ncbi:uncharacterized protein LOC119082100 [Bradysia coprophila]|uniref:uncharacterized protein LOC119082100 n=1 Tax=Bradysia coprophila TaxID=38358 RepID=UPI00187D809D|nr:uncharacterized protein LOC119082100 [Bradysia coprophila]XP_037047365.1 uncharacterized protein LOC119082100 [Bradysia coprophila]